MVSQSLCGLDGSTVDGLRALVDQLPEDVAAIVVDLSQVDFIDSAGLGVLVSLVRRTREWGAVTALAVPRSGIRAVLGDVGFDRVAVIVSSAQEAMGTVIADTCFHASWQGPGGDDEGRSIPPPIQCGSVEITVVRGQVSEPGVDRPRLGMSTCPRASPAVLDVRRVRSQTLISDTG
jgi:anti-sigma B factor antagonist